MQLKSLCNFQKMLTPYLVQGLFWFGVGVSWVSGLIALFAGSWQRALVMFILVPLFIRVGCEFFIVVFRMNQSLGQIAQHVGQKETS